jgi:hypothetical protein
MGSAPDVEAALLFDNMASIAEIIRYCFTVGHDMDRFDNMRVFVKVSEIGSFAGAAARLDISAWRASSQPHHAQGRPD